VNQLTPCHVVIISASGSFVVDGVMRRSSLTVLLFSSGLFVGMTRFRFLDGDDYAATKVIYIIKSPEKLQNILDKMLCGYGKTV
jgi:hypothetical protein